uniref:Uncharacterized protein n=1 Tax=Oryza barthii TaxID=65489 RepID=A0A0D3ESH5_9ORYZ
MAGRRRVVVLVVAAALLVAVASAGASGKSARFELLRLAPAASLADLARMDRERMAFISSRGRRRAAETASAFAMPLSSGAYTGTGQYFVRFRVGTPAQPREKTICVVRKVAEEKEGELEAADELEVVTTGPRLVVARIAREGGEGAQWQWPRRRLARSALTAAVPDRSTPPLGRCRQQRQLS